MKAYQTQSNYYRNVEIVEIEITRKTEQSIFVMQKGKERRVSRRSNYTNYFDTFEEAKESVTSRLLNKVVGLHKQWLDAQDSLAQAEALTTAKPQDNNTIL